MGVIASDGQDNQEVADHNEVVTTDDDVGRYNSIFF